MLEVPHVDFIRPCDVWRCVLAICVDEGSLKVIVLFLGCVIFGLCYFWVVLVFVG